MTDKSTITMFVNTLQTIFHPSTDEQSMELSALFNPLAREEIRYAHPSWRNGKTSMPLKIVPFTAAIFSLLNALNSTLSGRVRRLSDTLGCRAVGPSLESKREA